MRVLVIGGTGRISTPLVQRLVDRGDDVTIFNRGRTEVRLGQKVRTILGDRRVHAEFERKIGGAGDFDVAIDMIGYTAADAESLWRACRGRVGQLVFCSTVSVYRAPSGGYPISETEPRLPPDQYGKDKLKCEEILEQAAARGDFALTLLRPAHTYGEGGGLIGTFGTRSTFIDRIRRRLPIVVHGDGQTLWSACHADDVARAFAAAVGNHTTWGHAYNVAAEQWMTWDQYYSGIAHTLGVEPPRMVHIPASFLGLVLPNETQRCLESFQFSKIYNVSAAQRDLGFEQRVPWRDGVRRTLAWMELRGQIEAAEAFPLEDRLIAAWDRLTSEVAKEISAHRVELGPIA